MTDWFIIMCLTPYRQDVIHNLAIFLLNLKIPPLDKIYQEIPRLWYLIWSSEGNVMVNRNFSGLSGRARKTYPSNINTRKENGGAHGHNASESHKLITLNVLWLFIWNCEIEMPIDFIERSATRSTTMSKFTRPFEGCFPNSVGKPREVAISVTVCPFFRTETTNGYQVWTDIFKTRLVTERYD